MAGRWAPWLAKRPGPGHQGLRPERATSPALTCGTALPRTLSRRWSSASSRGRTGALGLIHTRCDGAVEVQGGAAAAEGVGPKRGRVPALVAIDESRGRDLVDHATIVQTA